jgi:hypothetical protein
VALACGFDMKPTQISCFSHQKEAREVAGRNKSNQSSIIESNYPPSLVVLTCEYI